MAICCLLCRLHQRYRLALLLLALVSSTQYRVVYEHVQNDDRQQTRRVHERVQLLVVPLEVVAQYEVVLLTVAEVDQPVIIVAVHHGGGSGGREAVVERRHGRVDLSGVRRVGRDDLGTPVDAEEHGYTRAERGGDGRQQTDEDFCAVEAQQSDEWMTDAEVAIDCNGHHNERRERDITRDDELIELAADVARHVEVDDLHVHGERYDNDARDEVHRRQRDDEQRRRQLVPFLGEDVQYQSVTGTADHRQHGQVRDDDIDLNIRDARRRRPSRQILRDRCRRHVFHAAAGFGCATERQKCAD